MIHFTCSSVLNRRLKSEGLKVGRQGQKGEKIFIGTRLLQIAHFVLNLFLPISAVYCLLWIENPAQTISWIDAIAHPLALFTIVLLLFMEILLCAYLPQHFLLMLAWFLSPYLSILFDYFLSSASPQFFPLKILSLALYQNGAVIAGYLFLILLGPFFSAHHPVRTWSFKDWRYHLLISLLQIPLLVAPLAFVIKIATPLIGWELFRFTEAQEKIRILYWLLFFVPFGLQCWSMFHKLRRLSIYQ